MPEEVLDTLKSMRKNEKEMRRLQTRYEKLLKNQYELRQTLNEKLDLTQTDIEWFPNRVLIFTKDKIVLDLDI